MGGPIHIGCAGWAIPKQHAALFPSAGSHLERYAQRFNAVEINSSFYRPHRRSTYERWAKAVPRGFLFAVKAPREITHARRLVDVSAALDAFLEQVMGLGEKLGPLLFQLPPRLAFDASVARAFLTELRATFQGGVVCEPRHRGWFVPQAEELLSEFRVGRVAADPAIVPRAGEPGGWPGLVYYRLHGSPRMYYSEYSPQRLEWIAEKLARAARNRRACWCIFDNTAAGAATINALTLLEQLKKIERSEPL